MRFSIIIRFLLACLLPLFAAAQVSHPPFRYVGTDSVLTFPSDRYISHSVLHDLLMGRNYRNVWSQPVRLPVFRLSKSGFTLSELGGGMQTKSLKLKDKQGKNWVLRTIDKDVKGAFSGFLKKTFVVDIAQDHVSAAMPYAPLVVAALLKRTDVPAPNPVIYFVADDPNLGEYRPIFANTVCMLEERDPDFDDTDNTKKMLRKIQESSKYVVNQKTLLEARLFDMLIADWDRHYDNWRWGEEDSAGQTAYQAIPRDRDWAFYYSGGFVPKLARLIALRFLINFKEEPTHFKNLSYKAYRFDGAFLNGMSRDDWKAALTSLRQSLTDPVIEKAVQKLPPEVYALAGPTFIRRLKSRRDGMEKEVMDYYNFLSRFVQIDGSNDREVFSFRPAENGLLLQIYRLPDDKKQERRKIYERRFSDKETYTILLNGLGNDDVFEIDEKVASSIKLTLNGGTGTDTFDLKGKVRSKVNDYKAEKTIVPNKSRAKLSFH